MENRKRFDLIDTETGELLSSVYPKENQEPVIKLISPKQQEAYNDRLELTEFLAKEGVFVHLIYHYREPIFTDLIAELGINKANLHIVRFLLLGTYLSFGNKLYDKNNHRIKKSSLGKIWGISNRNSINETYNILTKYNYIYQEGDYIMINNDVLIKGKVINYDSRKAIDTDLTYTRLFTKNLQEIYNNTDSRNKKKLGYLFNILPYVHYKYNVVCWNPTEIEKSKLELINWTDLASICGLEVESKNVSKLKKDLFALRVGGNRVIAEFKFDSRPKDYEIVINPKLFYSGSELEAYKSLISLFDIAKTK